MKKEVITFKEIEIKKGKEVVYKYHFYKNDLLVATILNDIEIYHDSLTEEEINEIKNIASQ